MGTEAPSGQPTSQPSGQPSSQPSGKPSGQPSSKPSGDPSSQPSSQPTGQPSSQPSSEPTSPTSQPSSIPTKLPTSKPTTLPTSKPSSEPTTSGPPPTSHPTSQPSLNPTRLYYQDIEIDVVQRVSSPGLNKTSFMTSESLITFKTAVANVSGLPLTSVNVSGADNVYGRRRLRALSGSNIIGVDVNYTLTTVVEDMGTNDPQTAVNTIQNILNTATSSGSFVAALQVAAVATGTSFLASVYNNVTIAAPVVEIGTISAVSNRRSPT